MSINTLLDLEKFDSYFKVRIHPDPESKLTGQMSGNAHAYRRIYHKNCGKHRYTTNEYIEEWVQSDGSSKFFVVRRYRATEWVSTSLKTIKEKEMTYSSNVISVIEYPSLDEAFKYWNASKPND